MYVNKCTKCGAEFETKNPKRVICPNCLYPDKKNESDTNPDNSENQEKQSYTNFSSESLEPRERTDERQRYPQQRYDGQRSYNRPQRPYNSGGGYNQQRSYNNNSYDRPRQPRPYDNNNNYNQQRPYNNNSYDRPRQPRQYDNRGNDGGYNRDNYNRGSYNNRPQGGGYQQRRPQRPFGASSRTPNRPPRQLLVNKDQLLQIEELYKKMLPLPNPDAHEVIGEQIGLEARKVFFGINLIRQKLMLPKLAYPKRKLAVSPDQLTAIKALYEPLLPLPPIGCHKILAAQLKIDEWRVHVGIGLIRKQMGLDRWNSERKDAPKEFKKKKTTKTAKAEKTEAVESTPPENEE